MDLLLFLASDPGLNRVQTNLVSNWIGPALFIVVGAIAIKFIISRQFRELAGFLGIAAVVALIIFNTDRLFGQRGIFTKIADWLANLL